jgi:chromosome segregation ATPase
VRNQMRKISDIKADLEKAIKANDQDKVGTLLTELTEAEAKMENALSKANKEAKENREKAEALEKAKNENKGKDKPDKEDEEDPEKDKDKREPEKDKDNKEMSDLKQTLKALTEKIDKLEGNLTTKEKAQTLEKSLSAAIKEAGITKDKEINYYRKHVKFDDLDPSSDDLSESLKSRIAETKQELNDLSIEAGAGANPLKAVGEIFNSEGKDIAKMRNDESSGSTSGGAPAAKIIPDEGK